MRRAIHLLLVFLLFALATLGAGSLLGIRIGGLAERLAGGPDRIPALTRQPGSAERLREAQGGYLRMLRAHPNDAAAMRGLVAVRRRMAGDEPAVLRRQAAAYRQMIASGMPSPEHYPRPVMELLARACLQGAAAVESDQRSAAQRARNVAPQRAPGAPADKGAIMAPALPSAPSQGGTVPPRGSTPEPRAPSSPGAAPPPSQGSPGSAASPPASTPPPAAPAPAPGPFAEPPAPAVPPSAPPAGSAPPQQPAGAPPGGPGDTIAVVPPQSAGPELAASEGNLTQVDCQNKTFVLHSANGDEEYLAAPLLTIYVRGTRSERLADFCALKGHIGRAAKVWSMPEGDRKVAKSVSVVAE